MVERPVNCLNCKYFLHDRNNANLGLCRRLPPQWTNDDRGWEFPVMQIVGWCGEYVAKLEMAVDGPARDKRKIRIRLPDDYGAWMG